MSKRSDRVTIFQKPTCSKCRETLRLLKERGVEFESINYYEKPLSSEQLRDLIRKLRLTPREVLRKDEPIARELRINKRFYG